MPVPLLTLPGYHDPQLIAHGTTALVFRAIQTRLNRPVAIKVVAAGAGRMSINAAREVASTATLSGQPHIVSIIDTGMTDDDRPYIVMEYCEDGSYAQILQRGGPLPIADALEVGTKIGEALHAAHQAGIVHGEVKPSNILRSRFGPALTDFGIARGPEEVGGTPTRETTTPHHASPEALLRQAQSGSSDIYSLASTLWTLLVGHPPFADPSRPAEDMYAFRDRVLHDALPPMPRDEVPTWLAVELDRALSKLPAQRHPSAIEFVEALRRGELGLARVSAPGARLPGASVHAPGVPAAAWPGQWPPDAPPADAPPADAPPADEPTADATPEALTPSAAATAPPRAAPADSPDCSPPDSAGDVDVPGRRRVSPVPGTPAPLESPADGGWLGPDTAEPPSTRSSLTRHVDERDPALAGPGRRDALLAGLIAAAVVALAGAAVVLVTGPGGRPPGGTSRGGAAPVTIAPAGTAGSNFAPGSSASAHRPPSPAPKPTPARTQFLTADPAGAPRKVTLADRGTSVTVSWIDPTSGSVPFVVAGRSAADELLELRQVRPSVTQVTYGGLDPRVNYCFLVTAVYSSTHVAASGWTCTSR